jgi:beta-lactam-binding protein with PASTA domain/tRNA A-37 threonylcarbamoyl transferase component Bud32
MTTGQRTLGERYEIGELLGSGGMAEVYRGRDSRLGRDVAIKLLRHEHASDPTFIARFRREAQSAASLNHPHIVAVYDTGEDNGVPFIVMEHVVGRTLRDVIRGEGPLMPRRACEVVADVCGALAFSHAAGIIHRDIKPANVMLTRAGTVKVMDFGIARAMAASSTMTQTAAVIGTAQYLSPEQARGEQLDARSDLYSTGCLLYEILTGRPPFVGDSPVAVAYQHVREDPVPPSRINPDIDPALDAVVLKSMAKNPGNRYQSADEMREDLLRAASGRAVRATPLLPPADPTQMMTPVTATTALGYEPERYDERRKGRGWAYFALALAALAIFGLTAWLVREVLDTGKPLVAVPKVVGLTQAKAVEALQAAELQVGDVTPRPDPTGKIKAGVVMEQDPAAEAEAETGSKVNLVVSSGPEQVDVPRLVGLSLKQAEKELLDAGLKVGEVRPEEQPGADPDEVLRSDPVVGTPVAVGSKVNLVVASRKITVPNVVGLQEEEALRKLEEAGFRHRTKEEFSDRPKGEVVEQSPKADTKAESNSVVTLVISSGPSPTPTQEPTTPPPVPTTPAATPPDEGDGSGS